MATITHGCYRFASSFEGVRETEARGFKRRSDLRCYGVDATIRTGPCSRS